MPVSLQSAPLRGDQSSGQQGLVMQLMPVDISAFACVNRPTQHIVCGLDEVAIRPLRAQIHRGTCGTSATVQRFSSSSSPGSR